MEMMKASLNGALDLKRMARDGMNRVHERAARNGQNVQQQHAQWEFDLLLTMRFSAIRVRAAARPATTVAKARTPAKAKGAAPLRGVDQPVLLRQAEIRATLA